MNNTSFKKDNVIMPFLSMPHIPSNEVRLYLPQKVKVYEFYAIADGCKKIYKEDDGVKELGKQKIIDPRKLSYMNLFINGVLQPKESYEVKKGKIILKTVDIPIKGSPVILQMFKF